MYNIDKVCAYITYFLHEETDRHVKKKTELEKAKEYLKEEAMQKINELYDELDERIEKINEEIYEIGGRIDEINELIEEHEENNGYNETEDEKIIRELEEEIRNISVF